MVVQDQIDRVKANVKMAYDELALLGAELPNTLNSDALPQTVQNIPAVLYTEQSKSSEEQAQARSNIGAASTGDLETGEWTATINGGTISAQHCTYMRVGNMCTISFEVEGTGASTATTNQDVTTNFLKITGVPFAPSAAARWYGGGGHQQGLAIPANHFFTGFILQRNTNDICARLTTTGNVSGQGYCNITNGAKAFYLSGSITYPIAN